MAWTTTEETTPLTTEMPVTVTEGTTCLAQEHQGLRLLQQNEASDWADMPLFTCLDIRMQWSNSSGGAGGANPTGVKSGIASITIGLLLIQLSCHHCQFQFIGGDLAEGRDVLRQPDQITAIAVV